MKKKINLLLMCLFLSFSVLGAAEALVELTEDDMKTLEQIANEVDGMTTENLQNLIETTLKNQQKEAEDALGIATNVEDKMSPEDAEKIEKLKNTLAENKEQLLQELKSFEKGDQFTKESIESRIKSSLSLSDEQLSKIGLNPDQIKNFQDNIVGAEGESVPLTNNADLNRIEGGSSTTQENIDAARKNGAASEGGAPAEAGVPTPAAGEGPVVPSTSIAGEVPPVAGAQADAKAAKDGVRSATKQREQAVNEHQVAKMELSQAKRAVAQAEKTAAKGSVITGRVDAELVRNENETVFWEKGENGDFVPSDFKPTPSEMSLLEDAAHTLQKDLTTGEVYFERTLRGKTIRVKIGKALGKDAEKLTVDDVQALANLGSTGMRRLSLQDGKMAFGDVNKIGDMVQGGEIVKSPGYVQYSSEEMGKLKAPRGGSGAASEGSLADLEDAEHAAYIKARDASGVMRKTLMSTQRFFENVGSRIMAVGSKLASFVQHVGMLIGQSLAFTFPNILYQQTVAAENLTALLKTVASPQKFGNLWLQIPPQLISSHDPTRSIFVYVQVPNDNGGRPFPLSFFSDTYLKNAQYFVVSSGQGVWGTTYLGSSSYTGQMLHLNSGWILAGEGISVNASAPCVPLLPALKGETVSAFLDSLFSEGQAVDYVANLGMEDWIPLSIQKGFGFAKGPRSANITDSPIIATMFTSVKTPSGYIFPPLLFHQAIASATSSAKMSKFAGIALKQMEGTGPLNLLLTPGIAWDNATVKSALQDLYNAQIAFRQSINQLSGTLDAIKKGQADALAALKNAQIAATNAIMSTITNNGQDNAEQNENGYPAEENISLYNYYIYEVDPLLNRSGYPTGTVTPALAALYRSREMLVVQGNNGKSITLPTLPPLKEYMVCLDADLNIVPRMIPTIVSSADNQSQSATPATQTTTSTDQSSTPVNSSAPANGATSKKVSATYQVVYQENPEIEYLVSLTTGFAYQANNPAHPNKTTGANGQQTFVDPYVLLPIVNSDGSPDLNFGLQVYKALYNLLIAGTDDVGMGVLNQIGKMSLYLNSKVQNGPIKLTSGFILERVPLETFAQFDTADKTTQTDMNNVLSSALSGVSINQAQANTFADQIKSMLNKYNSAQVQSIISNLYIYKVSNADGTGALSYTRKEKQSDGTYKNVFYDIPDYVVAAGFESQAQSASLSNSKFAVPTLNIVPLGSGLLINPRGLVEVSPETPIVGLFSLVTGQVKDQGYEPLSNAVMVNVPIKNYTSGKLQGAAQNNPSVTISTGASVLSVRTPLATAYMPGIFNPNNYFKNQSGKYVPNKSNNVLDIPPFYYGTYPVFGCPSASLFSPITIQGLSQNITVPQYLSALTSDVAMQNLSYGIMSALPANFSGFDVVYGANTSSLSANPVATRFPSLLTVFSQWTKSVLETEYFVAQAAMGPFMFSSGYNPVYLTATSLNDVLNGNYFYTATGFPNTDIFVCAQLTNTVSVQNSTSSGSTSSGSTSSGSTSSGSASSGSASSGSASSGSASSGSASSGSASSGSTSSGSTSSSSNVNLPALQNLIIGSAYDKDATQYIINLSDGSVYAPYNNAGVQINGRTVASNTNPVCQQYMQSNTIQTNANLQSMGNLCSIQKIGKYDVSQVLQMASTYQKNIAKASTMSSSLTAMIDNCMASYRALVESQTQPLSIAGLQLITTEAQINNGTYIYAKVPQVINQQVCSGNSATSQNSISATANQSTTSSNGSITVTQDPETLFNQADDYFVVGFVSTDYIITPQLITSSSCLSLISLVTGTIYSNQAGMVFNSNGTISNQSINLQWRIFPEWYVAYMQKANAGFKPQSISQILLQQISGKVDQSLATRMNCLSNLYFDQTTQTAQQNTPAQVNTITAGIISSLQPTSNPQLFMSGSKYYLLASPLLQEGATVDYSQGAMYFDFNMTMAAQDAQVGAYYLVAPASTNSSTGQSSDATSTAYQIIKTSEVSGFVLEGLRATYGITVEADGTQTRNLPVSQFAIPNPDKTTPFVTVTQNTTVSLNTMKNGSNPLQLAPGVTNPQVNKARGETYYYYYHSGLGSYFALVLDTQGHIVGTDPNITKTNINQRIYNEPYFVDIVTSDTYDLYGNPRKEKVTMAFPKLSAFDSKGGAVNAIPFLDAQNIPTLQMLQQATTVYSSPKPTSSAGVANDAGNQWSIVKIASGKYYLKRSVTDAPVDQYGNLYSDTPTTFDQYFDFNYTGHLTSSAAGTKIPLQDTGYGLFLQVGQYSSYDTESSNTQASSNSTNNNQTTVQSKVAPLKNGDPIVVPVDYVVADDLNKMRLYYGVSVDTSGNESFVVPKPNGIYTQNPLFMWQQSGMYDVDSAINVMYDNGFGYNTYTQIPYSTEYSFLITNGSVAGLTGSQQDPLIVNYSYVQAPAVQNQTTQSEQTPEYIVQQFVFNLYGSGQQTTNLSSQASGTSTPNQVMQNALESARANGYVQFQTSYQISLSGFADGSQSYVIQNMLSPVTITIDNVDYLQTQVPGVAYNYLSVASHISAQLQQLASSNNTPFVATQMNQNINNSALQSLGYQYLTGVTMCGMLQENSDTTSSIAMIVSNLDNTIDTALYVPVKSSAGVSFTTDPQVPGKFSIGINTLPQSYLQATSYIGVTYNDIFSMYYEFMYKTASADLMNALTASTSVVYNMQGTAQLAQNISYSALTAGVTGGGTLGAYLYSVTTPEPRILFTPINPSVVTAKFPATSSSSSSATSSQTTQSPIAQAYAGTMLAQLSASSDYYVDYADGVVFKLNGTGSSAVLKPAGFAIDAQSLNVLHTLYNNAIASYSKANGIALVTHSDYQQAQATTQKSSQIDTASVGTVNANGEITSLASNPTTFNISSPTSTTATP